MSGNGHATSRMFRGLCQQGAEVVVQQSILRVVLLAKTGELLQSGSEGLLQNGGGQARSLVEQRHSIAVAAELVVDVEVFKPSGVGR